MDCTDSFASDKILVVMKISVSNFRAQNNSFFKIFHKSTSPPDSEKGFKIVEPSGKILF